MKSSIGILAVARKEVRHIWRDKLSMLILLVLPGLIVGVFGFVLSSEIKELQIAVLNENHEPLVEQLFQKMDASDNFRIVKRLSHSGEICSVFAEQDIRMVIVVPAGFTKELVLSYNPKIHLFMDASDSKLALAVGSIARKLIASFIQETLPESAFLQTNAPPIVRFLYNPELRKEVMPIPGLMMIIFILISAIMLSISIVKEKEQGTARLLTLAPISVRDMLLGKSLPYLFITVFHIFSVWTINYFLFDVRIAGNPLLFLALNFLFAINSMAFGLLIASRVNRQIEVSIICWLFLFIPNVFLSGFIFPIITMPNVLQVIAWIIPGTSFIEAYRGIVFKGTGLQGNALPFVLLVVQVILVLLVSRKGFLKQSTS
jgi:ABC-2 type transport system permease protein